MDLEKVTILQNLLDRYYKLLCLLKNESVSSNFILLKIAYGTTKDMGVDLHFSMRDHTMRCGIMINPYYNGLLMKLMSHPALTLDKEIVIEALKKEIKDLKHILKMEDKKVMKEEIDLLNTQVDKLKDSFFGKRTFLGFIKYTFGKGVI